MPTATVMIGKVQYTLAPLVFDQMERAWPYLKKHADGLKQSVEGLSQEELAKQEVEASRDGISILAIALENIDTRNSPFFVEAPKPPVDDADEARYDAEMMANTKKRAFLIRKTMLAGEIPMMRGSILDLLEDSGLVELGNVAAEVDEFLASLREQNNSTVTSTNSLGSSSQPELKAATGGE